MRARHRSKSVHSSLAVVFLVAAIMLAGCRQPSGEPVNRVPHKVSDQGWHPGVHDPGSRLFRMPIR